MKNPVSFEAGVLFAAAALYLISASSANAESLKRDEIIRRLRIRADVYQVSDDGKKLLEVPGETRVLSGFSPEGKLRKDWSSSSSIGAFKLRHEWTLDSSGVLKAHFEEFSEEETDSKTGTPKDFKNPIHSEDKEATDFAAVTYPVTAIKGKRVILRFVPELGPDPTADSIGKFRLMGNGVAIYDSEGVLWANDLDLDGVFTGISTHRGTLLLSYQAFRGADPVGVANGNRIVIRMKDYPKVTLQADRDFVPPGMNAKVYVKYVKDRRTTGLNSIWTWDSTDEKKFLDRLK